LGEEMLEVSCYAGFDDVEGAVHGVCGRVDGFWRVDYRFCCGGGVEEFGDVGC